MTITAAPQRRVLIVDDSRTIRALIRRALDQDSRLEVVGEAADAYEARAAIRRLAPDVLTLDVEMPGMNGLVFLEALMRLRPMPVVMVSSRTVENSEAALRALALGAFDCADVSGLHQDPVQRARLADTVHAASGARVFRRQPPDSEITRAGRNGFDWNRKVVLIGSSTGGVDALERVLRTFPADGPPVLIAQHMPEHFLASFARRLDDSVAPEVRIADGGDEVRVGRVLIAPGGQRHLALSHRRFSLSVTPRADGSELHVPSVDVLFRSALPHAHRSLAVLLTGMGRDGAEGMAMLRAAGAETLVQSGETCVVDGMPRAARDIGAAVRVVPLDRIGADILEICSVERDAVP